MDRGVRVDGLDGEINVFCVLTLLHLEPRNLHVPVGRG